MCCLAGGVLEAAQQWTALEQLQLDIDGDFGQQQQQDDDEEEKEEDGHAAMEHFAATLLMHVLPMQQLRRLTLCIPALGACSAHVMLQLTQLTSLQLDASATPAAAAADLCAMSRLTNLKQLRLDWALAPHLPAGPEGPFCFPSSLVSLYLYSTKHTTAAPMACWLAHLPGCPQLQDLTLFYGVQQHASAHPSHVARLLAQHNPQLRSWAVYGSGLSDWSATVAGLADAEVPVGGQWRPDAHLAGLRRLQCLHGSSLFVRDQEDWQHLAQLTALTQLGRVVFEYAPPLQGGMPLPLVELVNAYHSLDGQALGRLLLACTMLQCAELSIYRGAAGHAPIVGPALPSHPTLLRLVLQQCCQWGDAAAAVAQFAALAPVLSGLQELELHQWPPPGAQGAAALPAFTPCTALTAVLFSYAPSAAAAGGNPVAPHQVDLVSMVAPLVQLQKLEVDNTPWVNPQVALVLQHMLPQLRSIILVSCGRLSGAGVAADGMGQQQQQQQQDEANEEEALVLKVKGLLRPGLKLCVLHFL